MYKRQRLAGVSHASICGGNGRCSTCRTRILIGGDGIVAPVGEETKVLQRIGAAPNIRLACQVKLQDDVYIHPMLKHAKPTDGHPRPTYVDGEEVDVTLLFADLRGFTQMANQRLPFDVVFILNQYFELMGEAIESSDGYLDKFIGDGIMAIFDSENGMGENCKNAVNAASKISENMKSLNGEMKIEFLKKNLIGI